MRERAKAKIFLKKEIKNIYSKPKKQWQQIGRINLVNYCTGEDAIPHIEFELDEEWRNQGIMSKELPKYLKLCKKYEHSRLIAIVKPDNAASIKILEKNGFIKFGSYTDNTLVYIIDLKIFKHINVFHEKIVKNINWKTE